MPECEFCKKSIMESVKHEAGCPEAAYDRTEAVSDFLRGHIAGYDSGMSCSESEFVSDYVSNFSQSYGLGYENGVTLRKQRGLIFANP